MEALARHFGVPPGYFFDDGLTDAATGDAEGLAALRVPEARRLAVRAAGLSVRSRQALAELADALAEAEAGGAGSRPAPADAGGLVGRGPAGARR